MNKHTHSTSLKRTLLAASLSMLIASPQISVADAESGKNIAPLKPDVPYLFVTHQGRSIRVERDIDASYLARGNIRGTLIQNAKSCPPLCLLPMTLDIPVDTWGENEIIDFMLNDMRDKRGTMIDIRSKSTYDIATIPGSEHWFIRDLMQEAEIDKLDKRFESFGARRHDGIPLLTRIKSMLGIVDTSNQTDEWDFSDAKTLVFWGVSPMEKAPVVAIEHMLQAGYPAHKLKWYRGGLASWQYWGFNMVSKPKR